MSDGTTTTQGPKQADESQPPTPPQQMDMSRLKELLYKEGWVILPGKKRLTIHHKKTGSMANGAAAKMVISTILGVVSTMQEAAVSTMHAREELQQFKEYVINSACRLYDVQAITLAAACSVLDCREAEFLESYESFVAARDKVE